MEKKSIINKKSVLKVITMTLGVLLMAVGIYFFKIPNGFSTGGVSGIGTILGSVTAAISPAKWIVILNVSLLVLGFIFLGRETGIFTVYCSLLLSGATELLEILFPLAQPLTDEPLLELVYAMLLTGIGSAMVFQSGATSGGTDILAMILKKYTKLDVGKALLCTDFIIAFSSLFFFGIKIGLLSLLGLFSKAFIVDGLIENINSCKYFVIITENPEQILDYITKNLKHSATIEIGEGAYMHQKKYMIHTVCKRIEGVRLRTKVKEIDPGAFVIITTSSEIVGRGFRNL